MQRYISKIFFAVKEHLIWRYKDTILGMTNCGEHPRPVLRKLIMRTAFLSNGTVFFGDEPVYSLADFIRQAEKTKCWLPFAQESQCMKDIQNCLLEGNDVVITGPAKRFVVRLLLDFECKEGFRLMISGSDATGVLDGAKATCRRALAEAEHITGIEAPLAITEELDVLQLQELTGGTV